MYKVTVGDCVLTAQDSEILGDVLKAAGITHNHPCGGKGICKKCTVKVNGEAVLSCRYEIRSDITVTLPEKENILSESGAEENTDFSDNMCFALDIGTTTLALALVSLDRNEIIRVITRPNPQRSFGADIMARIDYCSKSSSELLNKVLINEINGMISETGVQKALSLYAAGNTTMLHLFRNIDCSGMGTAPYTPAFLKAISSNGEALGLAGVCEIHSLPNISAFIGADIVAGLNLTGLPSENKYNLLIDLGTNAEIVLYSENSLICTSAAAGPCFEGTNISCGMSASDGAIYIFSFDKNQKPVFETIGAIPAKGVCGTGLIDIIASLVENGIIDKTGYMECECYRITDTVYVTQKDIRQYQLAKSAVYSAILTLIKTKDISFDNIDKIYVSGGFSAKISIENAVKTGLLPNISKEKYTALNNSSLLGTVKYALEKNDLTPYIQNSEYVDLSSDSIFSELFISNMEFENYTEVQ